MNSITSVLASGSLLGLTAGISPGPLTVLVIQSTLRSGFKSGLKVAIAPILTDVPILLAALVLFSNASGNSWIVSMISFCGAAFLAKLAVSSWNERIQLPDQDGLPHKDASALTGVISNLLNPHPYLFWITVGAPIILQPSHSPFLSATAFTASFFFFMVSVKIAMAAAASRFRKLITGPVYLAINRIASLALLGFAAHFLLKGLTETGLIP